MTRLDDGSPAEHGAEEVREALHLSVERLPPVPDLVERVHDRAGQLRRRRRRAGLAGTGLAVALAGAAFVVLPHRAITPGPVPTAPAPGGSGEPSSRPAARPSGSPSGSPSRSQSSPSGSPSRPSSGSSTVPAAQWGAPQFEDRFDSSVLAPDRWVRYTGSAASPQTLWSPGQVAVRGGVLQLGVARVSDIPPVARAGGVKVAGAGQRYGRWELRWRMTAAPGVVGQFLFLGEGPGGIGNAATLSSADRTLTLDDLVHGTRRQVTVDGRRFHTLAVELTPERVRWLLDGTVVSDQPGAAPTRPVVAALQALVQGSDCGAVPLPDDCAGPASFPQTLEVDRISFRPYRG